jgi:hypothetical protein
MVNYCVVICLFVCLLLVMKCCHAGLQSYSHTHPPKKIFHLYFSLHFVLVGIIHVVNEVMLYESAEELGLPLPDSTLAPAGSPVAGEGVSDEPSDMPSEAPTSEGLGVSSDFPSDMPSDAPSEVPSEEELMVSDLPSDMPSDAPSEVPTNEETLLLSDLPSDMPSDAPSDVPSDSGSDLLLLDVPSDVPSEAPSADGDVFTEMPTVDVIIDTTNAPSFTPPQPTGATTPPEGTCETVGKCHFWCCCCMQLLQWRFYCNLPLSHVSID